jgi:hypothetical protein
MPIKRILNTLGVVLEIKFWIGTAHARTWFSSGRFLKSFAYPVVIRGVASCFACKERCFLFWKPELRFHYCTVFWASWTHATPSRPSPKYIWILSCHLRLGLSCWLVSGFPIKTPNAFIISRRFPALYSHLALLDLFRLIIIFGDNKLTHFSYAVHFICAAQFVFR